jgi:hypothetical protein
MSRHRCPQTTRRRGPTPVSSPPAPTAERAEPVSRQNRERLRSVEAAGAAMAFAWGSSLGLVVWLLLLQPQLGKAQATPLSPAPHPSGGGQESPPPTGVPGSPVKGGTFSPHLLEFASGDFAFGVWTEASGCPQERLGSGLFPAPLGFRRSWPS